MISRRTAAGAPGKHAVGARLAGDHPLSVKPSAIGRETGFYRFSTWQESDAGDRPRADDCSLRNLHARRPWRSGGLLQRFYQGVARGVLAILSSISTPVFAAGQDAASVSLQPPVGSGDILSVGASLLLVVAAIVLCGWLYSRGQGLRIRGGGIINIIATQPLGPKERILLIEVADKQLVVGVTSTQVSTLHVFDQSVLRREGHPDQRVNFAERLKAILKGDAK